MSDNIDEMINKIKNNSADENKKLADELQSNLSKEQSEKLGSLLSNKELMNKLMASDAVKNIMNKLGGDSSGNK